MNNKYKIKYYDIRGNIHIEEMYAPNVKAVKMLFYLDNDGCDIIDVYLVDSNIDKSDDDSINDTTNDGDI